MNDPTSDGAFLAWQREHAGALAALQDAQRALSLARANAAALAVRARREDAAALQALIRAAIAANRASKRI